MRHRVTSIDILAQPHARERSSDPPPPSNRALLAIVRRRCMAKCSISGLSQSWDVMELLSSTAHDQRIPVLSWRRRQHHVGWRRPPAINSSQPTDRNDHAGRTIRRLDGLWESAWAQTGGQGAGGTAAVVQRLYQRLARYRTVNLKATVCVGRPSREPEIETPSDVATCLRAALPLTIDWHREVSIPLYQMPKLSMGSLAALMTFV